MGTEDLIRELENVEKEFRDKPVYTGETNIPIMCNDIIRKLRELDEKTKWHTGVPTEEGYYLIHLKKYYYKDTFGYIVAKWERSGWRTINIGSYWNLDEEIDAWQKIEPYKGV